jgi:hypothetical protein
MTDTQSPHTNTHSLPPLVAESYITHIRISEDAAHPSTPPPPSSVPDNKKPRIIVVAVRSTGRVRMHKARENNNGSFSIGKTWNLEDLSAIESFAYPDPNAPPLKQNHYQWAGSTGFLVTISKPYYWAASTSKEKDFFIASLVKIYRKYTKGQVPDLRGFDPRDLDQMLGAQQLPQPPPPRASPAAQDTPTPPRPPFADQQRPSSQNSRHRFRPPPENAEPASFQPQPRPSQDAGPRPSQDRAVRTKPSREQMQNSSREPRRAPSREPMHAPSREPMRAMSREPTQRAPAPAPAPSGFNNGPPPGARPRLTPQSSRAELKQPVLSDSPSASFASSTRTIPTTNDVPFQQQNPVQLTPARAEGRQQSYQSVRSERSIQSQRSNDSIGPAASAVSMFTSTLNQWKPPSREPSPQREASPRNPRPQPTTLEPSVFETLKNQRQPPVLDEMGRQPSTTSTNDRFPNGIQLPPERKRPYMPGGRQYSATDDPETEALRPPPLSTSRNVSGASTNTSTAATVGRAQSPHGLGVEKLLPPSESDHMPGGFYDTPTASNANLSSQSAPVDSLLETRTSEPTKAPTLPNLEPEEPTAQAPEPSEVPSEGEGHRPGLGPMVKKKTGPRLADALRKAAAAQGAFKPRAGGAAERMRALTETVSKAQGPDGINGVVPAPLRKQSSDVERTASPISPIKSGFPLSASEAVPEKGTRSFESEPLPKVADETGSIHQPVDGVNMEESIKRLEAERALPEVPQAPVIIPEPRRPKRRSAQQENHLRSLNIDPRLLDGRGIQFESILSDFGWGSGLLKGRQLEDLEADLKRELGRVEAGSWLGHLEQKDDRVDVVDQMLDRAIAECDELDGLLTIYSAELSTLNEDIAFIEAQSQGLQVQTANQKILHTELQKLVDTISISPRQLEPLRYGDFGDPESLMSVESSLLLLYKAMATIDPSVRSTNALSRSGPAADLDASDVGTMSALQEKRNIYMRESAEFCQRLMRHLDTSFASTLGAAKSALLQNPGGVGNATMKLNGPGFNLARANLCQFSPLLLFAKETNMTAWQNLLRMYYSKARPLYTDVFRDNTNTWRKGARTASGEASELLFTSVEKETSEGLSSTARKLTVKRSQTLARTFRSGSVDHKPTTIDRAQAGRMAPFEVFNGVLEEQVPLISMEQNFVVDLFHATSLENIDFADAVMANVPEARMGTDVTGRRLMEPDRAMARRVSDAMEETFGFWKDELRTLMEWAIAGDPIQGVGILTVLALHAYRLQETSQEFLLHNLNETSSRLQTLFQKFVDEQIHAIEDTKVKVKKRKGVIAFMKIFPSFSNAVENTFMQAAREYDGHAAVLGARQLIDDAYIRINKAMWDSLKVIARESPTAGAAAPAATTAHGLEYEDKEILNYHILLIENMNHYIEEVDDGGKEGTILAEWKAKAMMDRAEHMEEYVGRVVRRPLGKLIVSCQTAEKNIIYQTRH